MWMDGGSAMADCNVAASSLRLSSCGSWASLCCPPSFLCPLSCAALHCSFTTAAGLPTSSQLLAGVEEGLALLLHPPQYQQYQHAVSQLVTGLVHALHGIPPGSQALRARAEAALQQHIFMPLAAALQRLRGLAELAPGGSPAAVPAHQLRGAVWHLHAALHQVQALLNALESYSGEPAAAASGDGDGTAAAAAQLAGVSHAAACAFLSCWGQLAEVCAWCQLGGTAAGGGAAAPATAGLAALQRELYAEAAHCLSSCISLGAPGAFEQALPSFADSVATCFFLPGVYVGDLNQLQMPDVARPCIS